jgi:hypothetical protein
VLARLAVAASVAALSAGTMALPAAGHPGRVDDRDHDEVTNTSDNCPDVYNPDQRDTDHDAQQGAGGTGTPADPPADTGGDACDVDDDGDAVKDELDNCRTAENAGQTDTDVDGEGDPCDDDDDDDRVPDVKDNCVKVVNPDQADSDGDFIGDACDVDTPRRGSTTTTPTASSAPAAGQPTATTTTPTTAAASNTAPDDGRPPKLAVRLERGYRLGALQSGLAVAVTCSEGCKLTSTLRLGRTVLGRGAAGVEEAGRTYVFVRFVRGAMTRLSRVRRSSVVVTVVATDAAGHETTTERKLTLRR